MHPSSVVHGLATPQLEQPYLVYLEKVRRKSGRMGGCGGMGGGGESQSQVQH